jgi:hypothetical protein
MKKILASSGIVVLLSVSILILSSTTSSNATHAREPVIAAATGRTQVDGHETIVEILVLVPAGADAQASAVAALQRAYPEAQPLRDGPQSSGFTTTGLVWDALPVAVNYNNAGAAISGAQSELTAAMGTWTDVATSNFAFVSGPDTTRCPSLVKECPGPQQYDGKNDVGWINIADPSVLGVTWYSTSVDEFDMAIDNANFTWVNGCAGSYSLQTVYLHEVGHALGLGHSSIVEAVMYAYYGGPRCSLHQDDIDGVSSLYPEAGTPPPTATPSTPAATPTPAATVCPPGQARKGRC